MTWVAVGPSYSEDIWRLAVDLKVGKATNLNLPVTFSNSATISLPVLGYAVVTIDHSAKRLWLESRETYVQWE